MQTIKFNVANGKCKKFLLRFLNNSTKKYLKFYYRAILYYIVKLGFTLLSSFLAVETPMKLKFNITLTFGLVVVHKVNLSFMTGVSKTSYSRFVVF